MQKSDLEVLAPGSLVRVIQDGKSHAGKVGQFRKISSNNTAVLFINGRVCNISPERLVKHG